MRGFQWVNMIGSVLSYVLFPLSRYLKRRSSVQAKTELLFPDANVAEATNNGLPPAVADGTAVWDGSLTRSQTTPLDQCLSPSRATEDTEERMTDPRPEREGSQTPHADEEQLTSALHEAANGEAATETSEGRSAVMEREAQMRDQQQEGPVEAARQEDGEKIIHEVLHMKLSTADGNDSQGQSSEEALTDQLKDDAQESISQQHMQIQSTEESRAPPVTPAPTEVSECWDEYKVQIPDDRRDGASGSELPRPSLTSDAPAPVKPDGQHDAAAGGRLPGPAEDCSLWHFPAGSYYPAVEQVFPFEVIWRVWEELDSSATAAEGGFIPLRKDSMDFTVMSYNILAQDLLEANEDLYRHSPLKVLEWSLRCTLLIKEIQKWAPDILCLQEVQENHYNEHLHPVFSQMGYTCVYKRRTGTKTDGCATCYRSSHFSALSLTQLEFFKPETELLDRHNVGIVLLLQPVVAQGSTVQVKGPPLCVANTHLLFNPRRGDVKLAQLALMLAEVDRVVTSCRVRGQHCNVILCGDFNSVPHMPLYQLITTGQLYYHGLPTWMISGQEDLSYKTHCRRLFAPLWPSSLGITDNCQYTSVNDMFESQNQESGKRRYSHDFMLQLPYCPAACVRPPDLDLVPGVTDNTPDASSGNQPCDQRCSRVLSHRLDLESVYQHVLPGSGSSEVTTLNSEAGATVDYIFYSPQRMVSSEPEAGGDCGSRGLKLSGRLSLLSEDVLWGMNGLPNDTFPSDHLSLLAKFQLDLNSV